MMVIQKWKGHGFTLALALIFFEQNTSRGCLLVLNGSLFMIRSPSAPDGVVICPGCCCSSAASPLERCTAFCLPASIIELDGFSVAAPTLLIADIEKVFL